MAKEIFDYFDDYIDYPDDILDNPIPYGTLYQYVSSTFLNGLVNYATPLAFYQIDRYEEETKEKKELRIKGLEGLLKHKYLSCFQDDIIILSKIKEHSFIFFYFDMDSSDCCVGKFKTTDSDDIVIDSVERWLHNVKKSGEVQEPYDNGIMGYIKLPLNNLKSTWIKY